MARKETDSGDVIMLSVSSCPELGSSPILQASACSSKHLILEQSKWNVAVGYVQAEQRGSLVVLVKIGRSARRWWY